MSTSTIGENTADTYSGCDDTWTCENGGIVSTNFGTDSQLWVAKESPGDWCTVLIKFQGLSNITATDTVSAATLYMKVASGAVDPITITLRRLLRNWGEATATGATYDGTNAWTSTMGVGNGTDRSNTVTAAVSTDNTTGYHAFTSAQFIADVQDMVTTSATNYGWILERTDGSNDTGYREFKSSEAGDGDRPYLSVTYSVGGGGGGGSTVRRMTLLGAG